MTAKGEFDLEEFLKTIPRPWPLIVEVHGALKDYDDGVATPYQMDVLREAEKQLAEGDSDVRR